MICAVCYSNSLIEVEKQCELATNLGANFVELRVDGFEVIDYDILKRIIQNSKIPVILTARSEWKNISIEPRGESRKQLLRNLIDLKPQFIDLEYPVDLAMMKYVPDDMNIILTLLDWDGLAKIAIDEAIDLVNKNQKIIVKVVAKPNTISDLKQLWKWSKILHRNGVGNIIIGLGELGKLTRIKSQEMKNAWTYGKIDKNVGEPFLPGMLTFKTLEKAFAEDSWHFASISDENESPNSDRSFYKELYTEILECTGLSGVYLDLPITNRAELDQLLLWINDGLLDGARIVNRWKEEVISKLDHLDVSAIHTNSANCVVISKDGLVGYNTDVEAIKRVLSPHALKSIKRVYVEGEDNYIRAIATALRDTAETIVVREKDEVALNSITADFPTVISAKESFIEDFDLVICNASPEIGFERISPVPPKILQRARVVFDIVNGLENESETINKAEKNGIPTITQWDFVTTSSIIAYELWTNKTIPISQINVPITLSDKEQHTNSD